MSAAYRIHPLGDAALIIDFGNVIDEEVNNRVLSLFHQLQNTLPHIINLVPAYSSLTLFYSATALRSEGRTGFANLKAVVEKILAEPQSTPVTTQRRVRIPVCYEEAFAPDLDELAAANQLSRKEVIDLHTSKTYRVYMIGFLPGFAYLGAVDARIAAPRKAVPRTTVPAGAVGIAGFQTGIYPLPSPGGWNLIGRTPLNLFDAKNSSPVLLQPGDAVHFYSITENEFADYKSRTF